MLGGVPNGRGGMSILATKNLIYYYENQSYRSNPNWNIHGCTMP
jgi:hypothetical protein